MSRILLDTNGYVAAAQGEASAVEILSSTEEIFLSTTVLGELRSYAPSSSRSFAEKGGLSLPTTCGSQPVRSSTA